MARSGSKTWRKDYRWYGKRQTFTIGPYPQVRLADARRKAIDISEWVREGIDPSSQSPSRCWDAQHHSGIWSPRHQRDMREKLDNFLLPALAELPIDAIEPSHIKDRLQTPILSRGSNQQARRCNDVARRVIAPTLVQHYGRIKGARRDDAPLG